MEVRHGDDASYSNGRESRTAASPPASSPTTGGPLVAPKTEPIYKIYLGNLAQSTTEADLREVFERYGRILNIELRTGFGFVEFSSPSECEAALQGENGKEWFGNVIKVEHAQSRTSKVAMTSSTACYKCGLDGHWARECPNVPTKSRPRRPLSPHRSISPRPRGYPALSPPPAPYDYPDARGRHAYDDRDKYYAPPPRDYREPSRRSRYPEPPPPSAARDYREPPYYPEDRYGDRYARDYPPAPVAAAPRYEREYSREPPPPPAPVPRTLREPVRDYRDRDPRDDYRERDYYYRRPPQAIPAAAHAPASGGPSLASDSRYRYSSRRSPPVHHPSYDRQAPIDRYGDRDRRYADYPPLGPPPPGGRYRSASPPPPPLPPPSRRGASGAPGPRSPSPEYRGRPYR